MVEFYRKSIRKLCGSVEVCKRENVRDGTHYFCLINNKRAFLLEVNVWSHQSVLHRKALRLSAVRPTITTGGETSVRTSNAKPTKPHIIPSRFSNDASVMIIVFAERIRNITEILQKKKKKRRGEWWNERFFLCVSCYVFVYVQENIL